jgi:hypothetical protein
MKRFVEGDDSKEVSLLPDASTNWIRVDMAAGAHGASLQDHRGLSLRQVSHEATESPNYSHGYHTAVTVHGAKRLPLPLFIAGPLPSNLYLSF